MRFIVAMRIAAALCACVLIGIFLCLYSSDSHPHTPPPTNDRALGDNDDYTIPWTVWVNIVDGAGNPVPASAKAIPPRVTKDTEPLTVDLSQSAYLPVRVNRDGIVMLAADSIENALAFLRSLEPGELATIYLKDGATGDYVPLTLDDVREKKRPGTFPVSWLPACDDPVDPGSEHGCVDWRDCPGKGEVNENGRSVCRQNSPFIYFVEPVGTGRNRELPECKDPSGVCRAPSAQFPYGIDPTAITPVQAVAPWVLGTSYALEPIECRERRATGEHPVAVGGGCKSVGGVQECEAITPCLQEGGAK